MAAEGNWPLGAEHTLEYRDVKGRCTPENHIIALTKKYSETSDANETGGLSWAAGGRQSSRARFLQVLRVRAVRGRRHDFSVWSRCLPK